MPCIKGISAILCIGKIQGHIHHFIPCPFVVVEQLCGIVEAPFVHNFAVINNNAVCNNIRNENIVPAAHRKICVSHIFHFRPKRVAVVYVIINRLEHTLN